MKKYIKPAQTVSTTEVGQMLAESLIINTDATVDGEEALGKEHRDWDIWSIED